MYLSPQIRKYILDYLVMEKHFMKHHSLRGEVKDYTFIIAPLCLAFEGFVFKILRDIGFYKNDRSLGRSLETKNIEEYLENLSNKNTRKIREFLIKMSIDLKNHRNNILHFEGNSNLRNLNQARSKAQSILSDICTYINDAYSLGLIGSGSDESLSSLMEGIIQNKDISLSAILGPSRKREVVDERSRIVVFLRDEKKMTYSAIANILNKKNHTTVLNLYEREKKRKGKEQT